MIFLLFDLTMISLC